MRHLSRKKHWLYVKIRHLHHFMCSIIIISFRKVQTSVLWYRVIGERSTPAWEEKPPFFSHIPNVYIYIYIFAVNVLSKAGENPQFDSILFKLFLSDVKVKILINSWHFCFLDVLSAALRLIDTLRFQKMKGIKVVHILSKFYCYGICSSPVLNFQMFWY